MLLASLKNDLSIKPRHKALMCQNVLNLVMLKACKIKLKLRLIFHFTHSIKTSLWVWAVTWESIMSETKEIKKKALMLTKKEEDVQSYLAFSKCQELELEESSRNSKRPIQNKPYRGRKWEISKTLERKLEKQMWAGSKDPRTTVKTLVNDLTKLGIVLSRQRRQSLPTLGMLQCIKNKVKGSQRQEGGHKERGLCEEFETRPQAFCCNTGSGTSLWPPTGQRPKTYITPGDQTFSEDQSECNWLTSTKPWLESHWKSQSWTV